ncbi:MAG: glutathione peroxidase [Gammaproteobacteria bacterium]|nr:MAG: glutathione peroxidase [Gammaproteobacteria bacterium]
MRRLNSNASEDICDVYKGKVILVVNTASKCAFTNQYEGLEKLYQDYRERGLVVVGFPSNDFGGQEPGSEETIKNFCRLSYGIQFPMYEKIRVKGDEAAPLYKALASAAGQKPRWNFHKYLIDRYGNLAGSYSSFVKPESDTLVTAIEALL